MPPLDPLTVPLRGRFLLEAGAGTGKTYALALLFLRLLLEERLELNQILAVTFTRAATGELRERIRRRLREAMDHLSGRCPADPLLAALLEKQQSAEARHLLNRALMGMDEAAVYTIHSFCLRVLSDHAFELGSVFDEASLEQGNQFSLRMIEDFWRLRFYNAQGSRSQREAALYPDPEALLRALGPLSPALELEVVPSSDTARLADLEQRCTELLPQLTAFWAGNRDALAEVLANNPCLARNDKSYRKHDQVPKLLAAMDTLAETSTLPANLPDILCLLSARVMTENLLRKCKVEPPDHPFFDDFAEFWDAYKELQTRTRLELLHAARAFLQTERLRRKQEGQGCGLDDLPGDLDAALTRPGSGKRLAAVLAQRFPALLIDEFQDTDPLQYRIFSTIHHQGGHSLFMIGDPKQAIYSFRGADLFTYLRARRETPPERRLAMGVNYRAGAAMVAAVNAVFGLRDNPFLLGDDLPFYPQTAAPDAAASALRAGSPLAPLQALLLSEEDSGKALSKDIARKQAAERCAQTMAQILAEAGQGRFLLTERPPRPPGVADLAVLVRTNQEATLMAEALRQQGLRGIISGRESVFASREARHLAQVLAALCDPADQGLVRSCLASDLFGRDATSLQGLNPEDSAWETWLLSLQRYRRTWREQGPMAMLQQLFAEQHLTRRLSAWPNGERSLTNLLHLAELLQESSAARHGQAGLLRWLQRQIRHPDPDAEDQLLRLESEDDLIRILTIHRAKGLEFPLVFLPFLWAARKAPSMKNPKPLRFHQPEDFRHLLDLQGTEPQHLAWAAEELLGEELRLLYVALTRAQYACFFCWGQVREMEQSALGLLLHQGTTVTYGAALSRDLQALNASQEADQALLDFWLPTEEVTGQEYAQPSLPVSSLTARAFTGRIDPGWSSTSYSRLTADGEREREEGGRDESLWTGTGRVPAGPEDFHNIATFPQGALAGTCLHTLLEELDFSHPPAQQQELIVKVLRQHAFDPRWQEGLVHWLTELLRVELPGACSLGSLGPGDAIRELAFLFPLNQLELGRLNAILQDAGLVGLPAREPVLHGLMKGFIDLVFRHQGRYFLADYKSNYLGPTLEDYRPASLEAAMGKHQYHLQALIYSLALHRFLGARLRNYHYSEHFGGGYYLFLRGMRPQGPQGAGILQIKPPEALLLALDACCSGLEPKP